MLATNLHQLFGFSLFLFSPFFSWRLRPSVHLYVCPSVYLPVPRSLVFSRCVRVLMSVVTRGITYDCGMRVEQNKTIPLFASACLCVWCFLCCVLCVCVLAGLPLVQMQSPLPPSCSLLPSPSFLFNHSFTPVVNVWVGKSICTHTRVHIFVRASGLMQYFYFIFFKASHTHMICRQVESTHRCIQSQSFIISCPFNHP